MSDDKRKVPPKKFEHPPLGGHLPGDANDRQPDYIFPKNPLRPSPEPAKRPYEGTTFRLSDDNQHRFASVGILHR